MEKEDNNKLTPEEYRQKADEQMDALKHEWKVFAKTGIIIFVALFAIIIAGIAWFASNRQVTGTGMSIRVSGSDFELAAAGTVSDTGKYDDNMTDSTEGVAETIEGKSYVTTDGGHTSISWAITSDSHMANERSGRSGIDPGSSGKLTFYIIARKTGNLTVSLDLSLTGFSTVSESAGITEISDGSAEKQLMEGHILLFAGYDETKKEYSGWISADAQPWTMSIGTGNTATLARGEDGKLTWSASVTENTAYPVTIYWIWPEILGEYVFNNHDYIGERRPILFPKDNTQETVLNDPSLLPEDLFTKMGAVTDSDSSQNSNRYFKWDSTDEFKSLNPVNLLGNIRSGSFNMIEYGKLCSYYNMADQYLGETVRYVKLRVDAQ